MKGGVDDQIISLGLLYCHQISKSFILESQDYENLNKSRNNFYCLLFLFLFPKGFINLLNNLY